MSECCNTLWKSLTRKKTLQKDIMKTPLRRCLSVAHLTFFGVGQMAGAGVYVLTGAVAKTRAGPATIFSYIIAGLVAFMSALCYAEFGARVPLAGSSYSYAYLIIGEFLAFVIGWNILLEHVIGAASTARAWSSSLDVLCGNAISNVTMEYVGTFSSPSMAKYPDFVGPLFIFALAILVACGAEASLNFNAFTAALNLVLTIIIITAAFVYGDVRNFSEPNGFMPFGVSGVIAGASMCFYAYVGFDSISIAGEETENPAKAIPIANGLAMSIVMVMYAGMSLALVAIVQYTDIDPNAAYTAAFAKLGVKWAEITVTVGSLVAITGTTLGGIYSAPRCAYAMAEDGIIFTFLGYVNPKTKTPVISIFVFAFMAAILTCLLDVETLAEFVSLGTLIAVTMVAVCVIVLRYQTFDQCQFKLKPEADSPVETDSEKRQLTKTSSYENFGMLKPRFKDFSLLTSLPIGYGVSVLIFIMILCMIFAGSVVTYSTDDLMKGKPWSVILLTLFSVVALLCCLAMYAFEQNTAFLTFQMPLVPLLPSLSIFVNIILLMNLSLMAWLRFFLWMTIGLLIYFGYGMHHSKEKTQRKNTLEMAENEEESTSKKSYDSNGVTAPVGDSTTKTD